MTAVADALLAHHFAFRPVDASFMGIGGYDDRLPDASAGAADDERRGLAALRAMLAGTPEDDGVGAGLDRRLAAAQIAMADAALDHLPRFADPAWYTGEAAFAVIALLLPSGRPTPTAAVRLRLAGIPDFLADGRTRLSTVAAPRAQTLRATREAEAAAMFLTADMRLHPDWQTDWAAPAARAADAFRAFATAVAGLPDRPTACGGPYLELLMREVHGLDFGPAEAARWAGQRFAADGEELAELAARVDPTQTAEEIIAGLADRHPANPEAAIERYRALDAATRTAAGPLVSTADDYALDYRWLASCFANVARVLYFLPYRSPPADAAGTGSVYWVGPPPSDPDTWLRGNGDTTVKVIHAVHHGSVGHHTQNARARVAQSRLARVAGTDCALGLAFLSAGTMVEGWACYVQDMMAEVPDFYTPAERVYLKQLERRNVASVLVDIRLHTGEWSPAEAAAFYREAGFAPARIDAEITRNGVLPASRLMYATGIDAIRGLRARWRGSTRDFHDTLIGYGHVPVAWAGDEMARAGLLS